MQGIPVMKTGGNLENENFGSIKSAFLISFVAVVWRRVWLTAIVYCHHNKKQVSDDEILKCLKFHIFSPLGIGHQIKFALLKSLLLEHLDPEDCDNEHVCNAVQIYPEAYRIVLSGDEVDQHNFISTYAREIISTERKNVLKLVLQIKSLEKEYGTTEDHTLCNLCSSIEEYSHVNVRSKNSTDPYWNIIIEGLLNMLHDFYRN